MGGRRTAAVVLFAGSGLRLENVGFTGRRLAFLGRDGLQGGILAKDVVVQFERAVCFLHRTSHPLQVLFGIQPSVVAVRSCTGIAPCGGGNAPPVVARHDHDEPGVSNKVGV